jgi:Flp pilus assembly pilin Flp
MSLLSALGRTKDSVIETAYGLIAGWIAVLIVTAASLVGILVSAGLAR